MPKKTIYVKEADLALWARAEESAGDDSLSGVLTEALRRYLDGQSSLVGQVMLEGTAIAFWTRIQPMAAGWLIAVEDLLPGGSGQPSGPGVHAALAEAGLCGSPWEPPSEGSAPPWIWIPSHRIASIVLQQAPRSLGVDYPAVARQAWAILRQCAESKTPIAYGDLGQRLGGLHPLHEVPKVLDRIARYCRDHHHGDLTALVVSQRTGLPGQDFWRQNGWDLLTLADQVTHWQALVDQLQKDPGPETLSVE